MKTIVLKVNGMHCRSCEMLVQDGLEDIGVKTIEASHKESEVKVSFDPEKVSIEEIKKVIEKEGYGVD